MSASVAPALGGSSSHHSPVRSSSSLNPLAFLPPALSPFPPPAAGPSPAMASLLSLHSLHTIPSSVQAAPARRRAAGLVRCSLHGAAPSGASSVRTAAVASPNSILSERAFSALDGIGFDDEGEVSEEVGEEGFYDSEVDGEDEFGDEGEGAQGSAGIVGGEDELAIGKLGLPERLVVSLEKRGITHLFPIQRAVLLPALEGRDVIARAKTGTGKTLAFGIPIIKKLTEEDEGRYSRRSRLPRALVLAPTRELAKQVEKEIKESAPHLNTVCVYGGVSYNSQQSALSRGVDVVVGTPGRLIDLINSNNLQLGEVQFLVLDEADQMLAVGFEEDVEVILEKLPQQRQNMLFSATMPGWVKKLARKYLDNPLTIDLVGDQDEKLAEGIKLYAISTTAASKRTILSDLITVYAKGGKTIVFTQTKRDADDVSTALTSIIASEALHGDISQHQRERTLNGFRHGKFTVLVATDVAARGLDIPNVDLIVHYELPNDPETFVHRSGRTGRAGNVGTAILLFTNNQRRTVRSLERDVGCRFEFVSPPQMHEVLESSAEQASATLRGVHQDSIEHFLPAAERLTDELGTKALAAALAHLSGFSQPPSSRSLISHEQGWVTLQLTRDPGFSRGFFQAKHLMGLLGDVYSDAADEVGKIHLLADETVQGAIFDLPEDIAKELLNKELPPGNTLTRITKLPPLQDDGPPSDNYGRFSSWDRNSRNRNSRGSRSWGGRDSNHGSFSRNDGGFSRNDGSFSRNDGGFRRGTGRSFRNNESFRNDEFSDDDWLIGGRKSNRSSPISRERSSGRFGGSSGAFSGTCFSCGRSGHRASDCPNK